MRAGVSPGLVSSIKSAFMCLQIPFDFSAWKWLPVFWQEFVNMSVEWMRTNRPKILENNNSESGAASPAHCLELISNQSISQRQASDINRCFFPQLKPRVKLQRSRNEFAKRLDVVIQNDSNNSKQFITQCHHRFNQKQRSERIHEALEAVEL